MRLVGVSASLDMSSGLDMSSTADSVPNYYAHIVTGAAVDLGDPEIVVMADDGTPGGTVVETLDLPPTPTTPRSSPSTAGRPARGQRPTSTSPATACAR